MRKILFILVAAVCAFVACDPVHEDISDAGHISLDELLAQTSVGTDKSDDGKNGNIIICETKAPVNVVWDIAEKKKDGKEPEFGKNVFKSNYAQQKKKLGQYIVKMTAICSDGTKYVHLYNDVTCEVITRQLDRFNIYPRPGKEAEDKPFKPGSWNAPAMRFSDDEGQHFPTLTDAVYWGFKTLILDVSDVEDGTTMMVHNGWWSNTYYDNMVLQNGPNEIQLTEDIAKDCAKGKGGAAKDLQFLIKSGNCTVNSVYYEE